MVQLLWKAVQKFFKMSNIELPYDPTIPLPGIYPREMRTSPLPYAGKAIQELLQL